MKLVFLQFRCDGGFSGSRAHHRIAPQRRPTKIIHDFCLIGGDKPRPSAADERADTALVLMQEAETYSTRVNGPRIPTALAFRTRIEKHAIKSRIVVLQNVLPPALQHSDFCVLVGLPKRCDPGSTLGIGMHDGIGARVSASGCVHGVPAGWSAKAASAPARRPRAAAARRTGR